MKKVLKITKIAGNAMAVFSIIALLVMLFITLFDILLRQFFNAPITGSIEIARMMMVCMSPAFIAALVEKRHVSVGVFVDMLGRKGQLAFDTFGYLAAATMCGLMSYQGFVDMFRRIDQQAVYSMLRIPTWPFYLLFAVSMGLFAIAIVIYLIDIYLDKERYVKPPKGAKPA
ncbi:MAG: TRAP transporter small permease [Defluviitaleaceae bacterium]|nr:TRAP transporter small permease [Defluviitaleaceae bacterium]